MYDMKAMTEAEWFRAVSDRNYLRVKASVEDFKGTIDMDGDTGLIKAVRGNDIEMVRILAPHEAKSVNNDGRTALIIAAMHENPEACAILAPYEKEIKLPDNRTALMQAAATGSVTCVRALTDHFFQETDNQGWTALDYAVSSSNYDCVRILCETQKPTLKDLDRCIKAAEMNYRKPISNFLQNYKERAFSMDSWGPGVTQSIEDHVNTFANTNTGVSRTFDSNGMPLQTMYNESDLIATTNETKQQGPKAFDPQPNVYYNILGPRHAAAEMAAYNRTGSGASPNESLDVHGILPRKSLSGTYEYTQDSKVYVNPDQMSPHLAKQKNDKSLINTLSPREYRDYSTSRSTSISRYNTPEPYSYASDSRYSATGSSHYDTITELRELRSSIERSNEHQKVLESQLNILQATLDSTLRRSLSASGSSSTKMSASRGIDSLAYSGPVTPPIYSGYIASSQTMPQTTQLYADYTLERPMRDYSPDCATDYSVPVSNPPLQTLPVQTQQSLPASTGSYRSNTYFERKEYDDTCLDDDGNTALMLAVRAGDGVLLRDSLHLAKKLNKFGKTALMIAAECNNLDAVNLLVTREAKEHAFGDNDYTALMYAAQRGHANCVRTLIQYEARLHSRMGYTALMLAAQNNHVECVAALKPYEAGMQTPVGLTALICAASNGNDECVKLLVDREATMGTTHLSQQGAGFTALMAAARAGSYGCTRILLPYEAHLAQETGKTAQDWANESWYSNSRTRDLLFEYGVGKGIRV